MFAIPRTDKSQGQFIEPAIPYSAVQRASFAQGRHDTFWNVLTERYEDSTYADGETIGPDEANERYSLPGLEFNEPISEGLAALRFRRKQKEIARHTIMGLGVKSLASMRGVGSMATSIVANNLNPVDFAFNFVPIASATRYGRPLANLHRAGARGRFAGGLGRKVQRTSIAPVYKMMAASADAAVGNLILEVPLYYSNQRDQTEHTLSQSLASVGLGALFGGALSGLGQALRAASRKWKTARPSTKEKVAQESTDAFLVDKENEAADATFDADPAVIRERVSLKVQEELFRAIQASDAKASDIEASFAARIAAERNAGHIRQEDLVEVVEAILPELVKRKDPRVKIATRLLQRAKAEEPGAVENLASTFDVKIDPKAQSIPAIFGGGEGKVSVKDLSDLSEVLPDFDAIKKISDRVSAERQGEVEAQIRREVKQEQIRLVRESFRNSLRRIEEASPEVKAEQNHQAVKIENDKANPPSKAVTVEQRKSETEAEIQELLEIAGDKAPDSLKSRPTPVPKEAINKATECLISSAV